MTQPKLTLEDIETWRTEFSKRFETDAEIYRTELQSLCDMALRSLERGEARPMRSAESWVGEYNRVMDIDEPRMGDKLFYEDWFPDFIRRIQQDALSSRPDEQAISVRGDDP